MGIDEKLILQNQHVAGNSYKFTHILNHQKFDIRQKTRYLYLTFIHLSCIV